MLLIKLNNLMVHQWKVIALFCHKKTDMELKYSLKTCYTNIKQHKKVTFCVENKGKYCPVHSLKNRNYKKNRKIL